MAKDPTSQDDRASPQKARRKPLTIDLPAAEVGRKPEGDAHDAPKSDASASSAASASAYTAGKAGARSAPGDPVISSPFASHAAESSEAPKAAEPDASPDARPASERPREFSTLLVAAFAGAAIAAIVIAVLALSGYFTRAQDDDAETAAAIAALKSELAELRQTADSVAPLKAEVAALEKSVAEMAARAPAGADPTALKDVQDRLAKVEAAAAASEPGKDFQPQLTALASDVAALKNAAPPDIATFQATLTTLRNDIDTLSARVDGLPTEQRIAGIEAKLAETSREIENAAALAPAVAADALAAALDAGRPFANELAALQRLGVATEAVAGLAPQAEAGLPTLADLNAMFEQGIATVPLSTPIPESAGTVDRLVQSARSLVSVRPAHPTAGSDPAATVARIRGALAAGDLKSALAEWSSLPDPIKAPTADWAKAAEARRNADALAAEVRAAALANLGAGH